MVPDGIDWTSIAAWGAGAGTVISSIGGAIYYGLKQASKIAAATPPATTRQETNIITTDSVAMQRLTAALEARNVEAIEAQKMINELTAVLRLQATAVEENTRLVAKSVDETGELRVDLRELGREIRGLGSRIA